MEIGPARVWLKNSDTPGLAMSRSIGDQIARLVGVISVPGLKFDYLDIIEYKLTTKDKFIIIGSDGIWDFISNELAVKIVSKYYESNDSESATEELAKKARSLWSEVFFLLIRIIKI